MRCILETKLPSILERRLYWNQSNTPVVAAVVAVGHTFAAASFCPFRGPGLFQNIVPW